MNGDITRSTFDAEKRYTSVRKQQGRVQLDADWNEQRDLELHDERTFREDAIGATGSPLGANGAPAGEPGFEVSPSGTGLEVGAGRYYVEGIRVDNDASREIDGLPTDDGTYVAYLDVWERPITAVEDPDIREVALGGPDTATRTKVEWAVRFLKVDSVASPDCTSLLDEWGRLLTGATGTLQVREQEAGTTTDPCDVPESAGYRGLENRTYRVEIHAGNFDPTQPEGIGVGTPTFKWSRDNASTVGSWSEPSGLDVEVDRLGPGGTTGFERGGWVEFTTEAHDLAEEPGVLAEIDDVSGATLELVDGGSTAADLSAAYDADRVPRVRAWDSEGAGALETAAFAELDDDGIEVKFSESSSWRAGDYWIFAARTAILPGTTDRRVDWPVDETTGDSLALVAMGPTHQRARLAVVERASGSWSKLDDCRQGFAPATDQVSFTARGGDGQTAPSGHWLPDALAVGVSRGSHPVEGARVRFAVDGASGTLSKAAPGADGTGAAEASTVEVTTGTDGIARAWWRLGDGADPEPPGDTYQPEVGLTVGAELLDSGGAVAHLPLDFHAIPCDRLILVGAGGNGQLGEPGETLSVAIRARVSAGTRPAAGALVAFELPAEMLDGTALDQDTGGSLHASTLPFATEPWPGGTKTKRAVVYTDGEGVAQVQWRLGTDAAMTTQRLFATLIDASGAETNQRVLYTASLRTTLDGSWDACDSFADHQASRDASTISLQEAMDVVCDLLGGSVVSATVMANGGKQHQLDVQTIVPVEEFQKLRIQTDLPVSGAFAEEIARAVVDVAYDKPDEEDPRRRRRFLRPEDAAVTLHGPGALIQWRPDPDSLDKLKSDLNDGPGVLLVRLHPTVLAQHSPLSLPMRPDWIGTFRVQG